MANTPVPVTREEQYLSAIANGHGQVPETPFTRVEMYLDAILKNGGGGGSSGVQDIQIVGGHLMVTYATGEIEDKGEFAGNMNTATYDRDDSGVVDNAERVNGFSVNAEVPADVNDRVKAEVSDENLSLFK